MHQLRLQVLFVGDVALTEEERKREEERKEEIKGRKIILKSYGGHEEGRGGEEEGKEKKSKYDLYCSVQLRPCWPKGAQRR